MEYFIKLIKPTYKKKKKVKFFIILLQPQTYLAE